MMIIPLKHHPTTMMSFCKTNHKYLQLEAHTIHYNEIKNRKSENTSRV